MPRGLFPSDVERQFQNLPTSLEDLAQEALKSIRHEFNGDFKRQFFDKVGYRPHDVQQVIHDCESRFIAVTAGRRMGKSSLCAAEAAAMSTLPKKTIWLVAPTYDLCRRIFDEVWSMLVYSLGTEPARGSSFANGQLRLPNQSIISCRTLENPHSLVGAAVHLLVIDEVQMCDEMAWKEKLIPAISGQSVNGRVLMIGTPSPGHWVNDIIVDVESRKGTADEDPYWDVFQAPSYANPYLYPGGMDHPDIQMLRHQMPPEEFAEQVLGRPRRPRLQVYKEWDEEVHLAPEAVFNSALDVYLAFDPGTANGYGVLAFQYDAENRRVHVIDEFKEAGLAGYDVWQALRSRSWWGRVRLAVCDDAAPGEILFWCRSIESGGPGIATIPAWKQKGEPQASVAAGIRLVKQYFRDPVRYAEFATEKREALAKERWGALYDELDDVAQHECDREVDAQASVDVRRSWRNLLIAPHCTQLRDELKAYQYYQGRVAGRNLREAPDKKNDHLCDALRYYLFGLDPAGKKWGARRAPEQRRTGVAALRPLYGSHRPQRRVIGMPYAA